MPCRALRTEIARSAISNGYVCDLNRIGLTVPFCISSKPFSIAPDCDTHFRRRRNESRADNDNVVGVRYSMIGGAPCNDAEIGTVNAKPLQSAA